MDGFFRIDSIDLHLFAAFRKKFGVQNLIAFNKTDINFPGLRIVV